MANDTQMANAIRALAMDAVQQANSGHPGAPMGMADVAVALWGRHLRHNPRDPHWPDRDRFVLSNGHASMLVYALLHLTGYELPIGELKNFRQLHSKTAGHPEVGVTPGVETTTGPLGQGISNAVGMALAEKLLAAEFNREGHAIVDHHTYVFMGDGCLMEGVSHEACALAGAWKLNKLIAVYDNNGISIDGDVKPWFIDDTPARFKAYGWNVIGPLDGHDVEAVDRAIADARRSADRPTLIVAKTHIGKGSPNRANTAKAHGEALGLEEVKLTREALGWPHEPFTVPDEVYRDWDAREQGATTQADWDRRFAAYRAAHPELAGEFMRRMKGELPRNFSQVTVDAAVAAHAKAETVASRKASQLALEAFTAALPEMLGGSADLTGSNLTNTRSTPPLRFDLAGDVKLADGGAAGPDAPRRIGRHINYGVREFGMAAIMNGIALHGGYIPYGGTFLTFSDYSRNAIRMAALMKRRVIHGVHQGFHGPRRGRADPPGDRARGQPAPDPQPRCLAALRHGRDHRGLGGGVAEHEPAHRAAAVAAEPAVRAEGRAGRHQQGRLCAGGPGRGRPGPRAAGRDHRNRLRGAAGAQGTGAAGRPADRRARGFPAEHQRPRPSGRDLQGAGAAGRHPAHRRRDGRDRLLVEVRLRGRRRHRQLWRVGACQRAVQALRLHARERRRHRAQRPVVPALTRARFRLFHQFRKEPS